MCCQILNIGYLLLKALKFIFECMAEKDEKKNTVFFQEKRWKGEDLAIIQSCSISCSPQILKSESQRSNVTNIMNQMIIWF